MGERHVRIEIFDFVMLTFVLKKGVIMFHVKILSKEDIMQVIEMQPVIQCVEDVYKLKSEGDTVVWPTTFYEFDPGHADMDIKSGYLKGAKIFGHKTVSWFGANKEKGLPDLVGVIVVFDATNGLPIGILDGGYITGLRTGAAGAIGAKYLARPESETLFVLGAGNQAAFQIAAMLTLFPGLKKILVADMLDPQNAERFIEALSKRLAEEFGIDASGVTLEANSKLEEAVPQADVIITVTPSKAPVIRKEWVRPGTHLSCIGADAEGKEEIDPEIYRGAVIFVDDMVHCVEAGETEIPLKKGIISREDIAGEIGDLILQKVQGRTSDAQITIYDATGIALLDIAAGKAALDLAQEKNLGSDAVL